MAKRPIKSNTKNKNKNIILETPYVPELNRTVLYDGKMYRWLGKQWAEINPDTNKAGRMASKETSIQLNMLAKAKEVEYAGKRYRWLGRQWAEVNELTNKAGKIASKDLTEILTNLAKPPGLPAIIPPRNIVEVKPPPTPTIYVPPSQQKSPNYIVNYTGARDISFVDVEEEKEGIDLPYDPSWFKEETKKVTKKYTQSKNKSNQIDEKSLFEKINNALFSKMFPTLSKIMDMFEETEEKHDSSYNREIRKDSDLFTNSLSQIADRVDTSNQLLTSSIENQETTIDLLYKLLEKSKQQNIDAINSSNTDKIKKIFEGFALRLLGPTAFLTEQIYNMNKDGFTPSDEELINYYKDNPAQLEDIKKNKPEIYKQYLDAQQRLDKKSNSSSVTPTSPANPVTPISPDNPANPVNLTSPVTPTTSANPVTPANPKPSVNFINPTSPVTPDNPSNPVTPANSVISANPIPLNKPEVSENIINLKAKEITFSADNFVFQKRNGISDNVKEIQNASYNLSSTSSTSKNISEGTGDTVDFSGGSSEDGGQQMEAGELTTIKTSSGKSVQVAQKYAAQFQGFLNDLEKTGYKINEIGGYADRQNVNDTSKKSMHAYGAAIDINPSANPNNSTTTDLPKETADLAKKWGLGWGMNWNSIKDPMHFSAAPEEGGGSPQTDATKMDTASDGAKSNESSSMKPPSATPAPVSPSVSGGQVYKESTKNEMSAREASTPVVNITQQTTASYNPSLGVIQPPIDEDEPGNVEPLDSTIRYAKLFMMNSEYISYGSRLQ